MGRLITPRHSTSRFWGILVRREANRLSEGTGLRPWNIVVGVRVAAFTPLDEPWKALWMISRQPDRTAYIGRRTCQAALTPMHISPNMDVQTRQNADAGTGHKMTRTATCFATHQRRESIVVLALPPFDSGGYHYSSVSSVPTHPHDGLPKFRHSSRGEF